LRLDSLRAEPLSNKIYWVWAFVEGIERLAKNYINPGVAWKLRPNWKKKLGKENGTFCYSYGDIYRGQLPIILKTLKRSLEREAIISVWKPEYLEKRKKYQRVPCTLTLHFYKDESIKHAPKLNLFVNMRSSDVPNLLSYDLFHHSLLLRYVAAKIGCPIGSLFFRASHFYMHQKRWRHEKLERELAGMEDRIYTPFPMTVDPEKLDEDISNAYCWIYRAINGEDVIPIPEGLIYSPLISHLTNCILYKVQRRKGRKDLYKLDSSARTHYETLLKL